MFLAVGACKKKGGAGEAMSKMGDFKDKMCACKDAKCAQGVSDEMTKWGQEQAKGGDKDMKPSEDDAKKMADITKQMTDCMTKAMGAPGAGDTATPTPTATAPAAGGGAITSTDDYVAKGTAMLDKMTAIFAADGTDCDKLAADITKFMADNKGTMDAAKEWEKAHPDDKKAMDKKAEPQEKAFMDKAGPAIDKCKGNKALEEALKGMD